MPHPTTLGSRGVHLQARLLLSIIPDPRSVLFVTGAPNYPKRGPQLGCIFPSSTAREIEYPALCFGWFAVHTDSWRCLLSLMGRVGCVNCDYGGLDRIAKPKADMILV